MKLFLFLFLGTLCVSNIRAQGQPDQETTQNKFRIAYNIGLGMSYTDKAVLVNMSTSIDLDFKLAENYFLQFAPKYTYLLKWSEHYLTLPLHFGVNLNRRISIAVGPAISYDLGYFKDIGVSAALYYHFNERTAISISAFSFTLYDYDIDYLYIPFAVSYNLVLFN